MKKFTLKRIATSPEGTFGVLIEDNIPFAVSLELQDRGNEQGISCIPAGRYLCKRRWYIRGKYSTFVVTGVPNRYDILFHKGNIKDDTAGCILVAEQFERLKIKDTWITAILRSRKGFSEFMERLQGEQEFDLTILDYTKGGTGAGPDIPIESVWPGGIPC